MQHDVITRWTCRLCGTARLDGGNYRHCPSCGHGRDHEDATLLPTWEEFLGETADPFQGSERGCCGLTFSAEARHCGACGSDLEGLDDDLIDLTHLVEDDPRVDGWAFRIVETRSRGAYGGGDDRLVDAVVDEEPAESLPAIA